MYQTSRAKSLLGLLLVLPACGGSSSGPDQVVRQYIAAINANRPEQAYSLLDAKTRRQVSKNQFVNRWNQARAELKDQAALLRAGLDKPFQIRAHVEYAQGAVSDLSYVDGRWRIKEGITIKLQTATPEDAVRAFIQAVEQRDYETVMQLLSRSAREVIEREINDRVSRAKAALKQQIEVTGNKARVQYGPSDKLELIKEDGQWRINDF